jgi:hypothetical protein
VLQTRQLLIEPERPSEQTLIHLNMQPLPRATSRRIGAPASAAKWARLRGRTSYPRTHQR